MKKAIVHIDISPKQDVKCCNNCKEFTKFGVRSGYCSVKGKGKMDYQKCVKFQYEPDKENL